MKSIELSLHRFFTPFVPQSFTTILWDRASLKQAIVAGPQHPKYIRAKNLVDKIKAKEVHLCKRTAMDLGYLVPAQDGWALSQQGEEFCRKQMAYAKGGNPCQVAQWGTIERSMWTLMDRTFDVLYYHPKHQSEAGRLFAYLMQEQDIDKLVEAAVKVLTNDQDQVASCPEDEFGQDEDDSAWEDAHDEYMADHGDDEDLSDTENELVIGEDPTAPLLDRIMDEYLHMKEEGAVGCTPDSKLWKLLMEVVELKTEFGSEKDYFNLPEVGEFELEKPIKPKKDASEAVKQAYKEAMVAYNEELARYKAYRLDSLREGYSDEPNYEFLDLDIPMFEEERVSVVPREVFSQEFKAQLKAAYLAKVEELKDLDSPDKVMRDAYLTIVHTMGEGKFEEVAAAIA